MHRVDAAPILGRAMPILTCHFWMDMLKKAYQIAKAALRRRGIPPSRREWLAEEAAQEAAAELIARGRGDTPPGQAELDRAVWRCTARLARRDAPAPPIPDDRHDRRTREPWEELGDREAWEKTLAGLDREQREILARIVAGRMPTKKSGHIHLSAFAEELGLARRTLGRRLRRLAERLDLPAANPGSRVRRR